MSSSKVIGGPSGKIRTIPLPSRGRKEDGSSGGKKKWLAMVLLLLITGIAWAFWPRESMADRVAALRGQLDAEGMSRTDRRELISNADPAVREAMFDAWEQEREARERKWLNEFFAMSKEEQLAAIDKRIDEMLRWRKSREQSAKSNNNNNQNRGNNGQNGNGNRGNAGNRDSISRRDNYLAKTTPDQRAQRNEYRYQMQQRMGQRGVSGGGGGGGGGGWGGRGGGRGGRG